MVDVGANEGQFGGLLRDLGFGGDIHSFEPVKAIYDRLSRLAIDDVRWTTHNVALGDKSGKATINVSEHSVLSSLLVPSDYGSRLYDNIKIVRQEEIEITTFDEFHDGCLKGQGRRIMLKMDTQGYDLQVLAGAERSLAEIHCMMSELSLLPIYQGMTHYLEALAAYEKKGFAVSGIYPIDRNSDMSLIEADCLLVNRARF